MTAFELHIVFDCADPDRVARFWMAALGGYDFPVPVPDGFAGWEEWADAQGIPVEQRPTARTLVDKVRDRPDIFFLQVPEPKVVKNRLHLDIKVALGLSGDDRRTAIDAEVERLTGLGATVVRRADEPDGYLVVMGDPESNEFCVN
ncbi:VOC family protein [Kribbella sp. NBC_01505]|uniref:VOC family protein n=1 Tax=Kribbella sp. NBC_01505 TaxID=2903580 RepID=UPI003864E071